MASPTSEEPGSCTSTTIITAEGNTGHTAADTGIPCSNPTCETHETGTTNTTTTAGAGGVRQCVQIHHVRPTRPEPPTLPLQVNLQINLKDISWNWFIRDRLTKDMITTVLGPPDVVRWQTAAGKKDCRLE
ncbi:host cell factor 1b isoform X1 [Channa argus]|uniref:host cell factor 1b isoform X1 n=1 Tax=Channa argus TaxID=215402 RepID=UPI0035200304